MKTNLKFTPPHSLIKVKVFSFILTTILLSESIFAQNIFPSSGNVGIGAPSPTSPLSVISLQVGLTNPIVELSATSSTFPNNQLRDILLIKNFQSNWTFKTDFVVRNNGNVGIGTATPSSALDVIGETKTTSLTVSGIGNFIGALLANNSVRTNNSDIYLRSGSDVNHGLGFYDNTGQAKVFANISINGPVLYGFGGGALATKAGGDKIALRWNSAGQVIIGEVTTPSSPAYSYGLYVEKGILTERLKCAIRTTSDWSDFVFEESYNLMPLGEVANFITKNKHLPNVPSAKDVLTDGIDMAKMDAKLLEKIEELTLYLIELNKENTSIRNELLAIKKLGK